jgi:arylsulfatase B
LPELLADAGYSVRACIGKWHLGHSTTDDLPLAHGFTHFYGHYNGAIDYFTHVREGEVDWHRNEKTIREEGYSTDLLAAEAVRTISSLPQDNPWFIYLAFNAPHGPFQAKEEDLAKYSRFKMPNRRAYAAMVDSMDEAIGKVLAAVERRPDAENTLIVFFSDNGGILNVGSSNAPWRGAKLGVYEGGTRVCAAVRWPAGGLAGGRTFDGRIGYIDVLPTCLAAAGVQPPSDVDGINVLPAIRGQQTLPTRQWFSYIHQSGDAYASVHDGQWKLVVHGDITPGTTTETPQLELYDLAVDPVEAHDIAPNKPELVTRLLESLRDFGKLQRPGVGSYEEGRVGFSPPKDWIIQVGNNAGRE